MEPNGTPAVLSAAQVLYGNTGGGTPAGAASSAPAVTTEAVSAAEVMYGNPGGDPPAGGDYEPALGSTFNRLEYQARASNDHVLAQELADARKALGGVLNELGVSTNAARDIACLIRDYLESPRDEEGAAKEYARTMKVLEGEWGSRMPKNIEGAKRVIEVMTGKTAGFKEFLFGTGMANNEQLVRLLVGIAKRRGWTK